MPKRRALSLDKFLVGLAARWSSSLCRFAPRFWRGCDLDALVNLRERCLISVLDERGPYDALLYMTRYFVLNHQRTIWMPHTHYLCEWELPRHLHDDNVLMQMCGSVKLVYW